MVIRHHWIASWKIEARDATQYCDEAQGGQHKKERRGGGIGIDVIKATYNKIGTRMTIGPLVDFENGERDMHELPV